MTTFQCIFLVLQRQKDLAAFISSIPLHQRRISHNPDREDQVSVGRQAVSKFPRTVISAKFVVDISCSLPFASSSLYSPCISHMLE